MFRHKHFFFWKLEGKSRVELPVGFPMIGSRAACCRGATLSGPPSGVATRGAFPAARREQFNAISNLSTISTGREISSSKQQICC